MKLVPKTGSTFAQKLVGQCMPIKRFRITHDVLSMAPEHKAKDFVVMTMRNPCDLYNSIAHYGGGPGHTARPYHVPWYGINTSMGANPIPEYKSYNTSKYKYHQVADIRHNLPQKMLEDYVMAVRRKGSGIGWYSFLMWDQIISPECWFQRFIDKNGTYTWGSSPELTAAWKDCYGAKARHRPNIDAFKWKPKDSAHCWLFQETLLADLRECLEAWEQSHERHAGVINWTHFEAVERGQVIALTDKSKSVENAHARHGECSSYNPGLGHVVRKTDRMLFDKFGYTTCCGKRTAPMEE